MIKPGTPSAILSILLGLSIGSPGCHAPRKEDPDGIADRAEHVDKTIRLPACEQVLRALSKAYIEPERLQIARLRDAACGALDLVPELDVRARSDSDEIALTGPNEVLVVSCPRAGPVFSHASCLRRLGYAADRLVADLTPARIDRLLADSLLVDLDPHTLLMWNDAQTCQFTPEGCGDIDTGIGVRLARVGRNPTILSVSRGGPAYRAGLKPGDKLFSIDGLPVAGLGPLETDWLLRGPKGSQVVLIIERPGAGRPMRARVERRPLAKQEAFHGSHADGVAVVRIEAFVPGVARKVADWLEDGREVSAVVLDLRDNPGGLITEALQLADLFMDWGALVVVRDRAGQRKVDVPAASKGTFKRVPLAVLVNAQSASASELLAGSLKDNQRAVVLGQRTFGKGTMQMPIEVRGGIFLMTVSQFTTGAGTAIQVRGVTPDVELRKVVVARDRLRLRHFPKPLREAFQPHVLGAASLTPEAPSAVRLRYLSDGSAASDAAIPLTVKLVKRIPWMGELATRAEKVAEKLSAIEEEKIARALGRIGSSSASKEVGPAVFSVEVAKQRVQAGREARLPIVVRNRAARVLEGLTCHLKTGNPVFGDRELAFPPIPAGKEATVEVAAYLPVNAIDREDPVELVFRSPGGPVAPKPAPARFLLRVEEPPEPVLGLDVVLGGDRRRDHVCPGDQIEVCATVRNFSGRSTPAFVAVDARGGPITGWRRGYHRFQALDPGEQVQACFAGVARSRLQDGSAAQTVHFGDRTGRVLGSRSVEVETRARCGTGAGQGAARVDTGARRAEFSPWLDVVADRLAVKAGPIDLRIRAKANGGRLKDLTIYVAGKKVIHRPIGEAEIDLDLAVPILDPGSNLVQVLIRKGSKAFSWERFRVYRLEGP